MPGPEGDKWYDGYEDSLFEQHVLKVVEDHDPSVPLFLFYAPHIVHAPLQVPRHYYEKVRSGPTLSPTLHAPPTLTLSLSPLLTLSSPHSLLSTSSISSRKLATIKTSTTGSSTTQW
jgi:hypothetical protein